MSTFTSLSLAVSMLLAFAVTALAQDPADDQHETNADSVSSSHAFLESLVGSGHALVGKGLKADVLTGVLGAWEAGR